MTQTPRVHTVPKSLTTLDATATPVPVSSTAAPLGLAAAGPLPDRHLRPP